MSAEAFCARPLSEKIIEQAQHAATWIMEQVTAGFVS